MYIIGETPITS